MDTIGNSDSLRKIRARWLSLAKTASIASMLTVRAHSSIQSIGREAWNALGNTDFPFADFLYFQALEASGSVGGETGWEPVYLTVEKNKEVVGGSYLYLKRHSYGEYIFDWAWAEAYQRHQVVYYPKLLSAIPFTPATGPKLLIREGEDRGQVAAALIKKALEISEAHKLSSLHYLFITEDEIKHFTHAGLFVRHSFQYHWHNRDYRDFDDFLGRLKSRKRKQIAKERRELEETDVKISELTGDNLTTRHAEEFYRFYLSTIEKMGAIPYLRAEFFERVFSEMGNEIILYWATQNEKPVAASLCYQRGKVLYGRYWGAVAEIKNLHFELCYYRPMELAIKRKLERFEAGAQGEHKVPRGFLPTLTYSAHHITHPAFQEAIERFVEDEKGAIRAYFRQMEEQSPFTEVPINNR